MQVADAEGCCAGKRAASYTAFAVAALCASIAAGAEPDRRGLPEILKEDQQRRQAPAIRTPPQVDAPEVKRAVKPPPGELKVEVKGFRFRGLTVMPPERLEPAVAPFIGPDKTFEDLQAAAQAVSEFLQARGYVVAQAYLPEQNLDEGIVEIAILEGRLAEVRLELDPNAPVDRGIIEGLLSSLVPGTLTYRDKLERALFLLSDLRGIKVHSSVEAGPDPGTSSLIVKVTPDRRVDALVEFDNHSSRFTGDYRLGVGVNLNSPFGRGDLLSFRGVLGVPGGGADLDFGRVSYLTPIGTYGTKIGVAYLRLQYHLGTSLFDPLDQRGTADVASAFVLHPIVRSRNFNVFGQASFDQREFEDDRRSVGIVSNRRTNVGMFALVGDSRDALLGGGINNFSLSIISGDLDIKSAADRSADQSTVAGRFTLGSYARMNGTFSRLNAITDNTQLFATYSFQFASKNLDPSEKFGLGGPTAVRAYAVGEAASDEAHFFSVELRHGLPQFGGIPGNLIASVFYDWAHGVSNKNPLPIDPPNTRTLQGIGIGLRWARQDDFNVAVTLAWRLSGAPIADPADRRPRLYFQLQKYL